MTGVSRLALNITYCLICTYIEADHRKILLTLIPLYVCQLYKCGLAAIIDEEMVSET